MTIKEKLLQEFEAAIIATYGDKADEEFDVELVCDSIIQSIANKVKFYLG